MLHVGGVLAATMERALDGVGEGCHLHVSFDVDFLDPDIAPGVGTAVKGGPTYREAQLVMSTKKSTTRTDRSCGGVAHASWAVNRSW